MTYVYIPTRNTALRLQPIVISRIHPAPHLTHNSLVQPPSHHPFLPGSTRWVQRRLSKSNRSDIERCLFQTHQDNKQPSQHPLLSMSFIHLPKLLSHLLSLRESLKREYLCSSSVETRLNSFGVLASPKEYSEDVTQGTFGVEGKIECSHSCVCESGTMLACEFLELLDDTMLLCDGSVPTVESALLLMRWPGFLAQYVKSCFQ